MERISMHGTLIEFFSDPYAEALGTARDGGALIT